jgi:uncharacterized repeat protein (TIGR02543 family)
MLFEPGEFTTMLSGRKKRGSGYGRRWLSAVAVGALALSTVLAGGASPALASSGTCALAGAGTSGDPWLVSDAAGLALVGATPCTLAGAYEQTTSITLSAPWTPIGSFSNPFTGSFLGQGSISGLTINAASSDYQGMFAATGPTAVLQNIALVNVSVRGKDRVGALVGFNGGLVESSSVTGTVAGDSNVGGLVGENGGGGSRSGVNNSTAAAVVTGTLGVDSSGFLFSGVGGLVGLYTGGFVSGSSATGGVTGGNDVGGLVGRVGGGGRAVATSFATGAVTGSNNVGGLVGLIESTNSVRQSFATGAVTGRVGSNNTAVGGLVGANDGGFVEGTYASGGVTGVTGVGGLVGINGGSVLNSYATGAVTSGVNVNSDSGGLVGVNGGSITNSYATGAVSPPSSTTGGLVGFDESGTVVESFWDTQTTGRTISGGGTSKTTAEMKLVGTFTAAPNAWPMVDYIDYSPANGQVWGICGSANSGYPYLLWQLNSDPCPPHPVLFNSQSGSPVADLSYRTGGSVVLPAAPTRAGFTFAGWFVASSGGSVLPSPYSPGGTGAITLFAQWTALSYVVSFDSQGGSAVPARSYSTGGSVVLPAAPTRANFTFAGWFESPSGGSVLASPWFPGGMAARTLHARWTIDSYPVIFDTQGGSAVGNRIYDFGGGVSLSLVPAPTRAGFAFAGWFLASSGGNALPSPWSPGGTGAITVFAQWTAVSAPPGPVTGTVNGITFTANSTDPAGGATITAYSGPGGALTVPGTFTFGGVTYPVTGIGTNAFRQMGLTSVTIPNSVTIIGDNAFRDNLLASVVIPNNVTTIGNAAFIGNQLTLATIGTSVTTVGNGAFAANPLLRLLVPASATGVGIHPLGFCAVPSNLRTVTFDSAGGSVVSRGIACSALAVPAPVAPTRAGFTLAGWSVAPTGGALFDFTSAVTANTTLFAQWTAVAAPVVPSVPSVTIPPSAAGQLATTGTTLSLADPIGMAMLLLVAGGLGLVAGRRRVWKHV